jgi:predicted molibdopterin-dependent oxidoreductase YjgC
MEEKFRGGGRRRPLAELEKAEVLFVVGANPTQSTPVMGYYLKRASRMKNIPLILVDPRRTDMTPFSTLWLPLTPVPQNCFKGKG